MGVSDPALAVDGSGNPVVAWMQSGTSGFQASQWDGSAWGLLGSATTTSSCTAGAGIGVTVDASGAPVVTSYDIGGTGPIEVARWDGTSWSDLPSVGSGDGRTAIAATADGLLVASIRYHSGGGGSDVYVEHWNGSAWEGPAGSASGGGVSSTSGYSTASAMAAALP